MSAPLLTFIVPFGGPDQVGLMRTLRNLISQGEDIPIDVMVACDGPNREVESLVHSFSSEARKAGRKAGFTYWHTPEKAGTGNLPRAAALKIAVGDWVVFCDAGTAVVEDFNRGVRTAIEQFPDSWIITWNVIQLVDPVPVATYGDTWNNHDRSRGLPYCIPGIGAAVRRDWAQKVEWPNVDASDFAYFSLLWREMFGLPENDALVNKHVTWLQAPLVVAYGNSSQRRFRRKFTEEDFAKAGYDRGFSADERG